MIEQFQRSPRPSNGLGSHSHIADSAISVGVVLLALRLLREPRSASR
ncbi:MAG TPA: hypothetical protein VE932_11425 [Patescibacteria group bacterium]|nr:hypothetical protein [Patescibacteria group bacterium]